MKEPHSSGVGERVLKGSFWVIAAIHIAVFTAIGLATRQWRLLIIFLCGFVLILTLYALFRLWQSRRRR
jgi:hypothetical protein